MATREPGIYRTHDASYRVLEMPGRAAMRLVERQDGRWRAVAELPSDALWQGPDALPADERFAFAGVEAPSSEIGMRDWLAVLEGQRHAVRQTLLGLLRGYDAERVFSADTFDRDYDVDLGASADAAVPLLVALEDAIDTVRRCIERPRGRTRVEVPADATVQQLLTDFADRWGPVRLELFNPSDEYYREGLPDRPEPAEPVARKREPSDVELLGTMTARNVRDALYRAFGIEAQVYGTRGDETLDAAASRSA